MPLLSDKKALPFLFLFCKKILNRKGIPKQVKANCKEVGSFASIAKSEDAVDGGKAANRAIEAIRII